MREAEYKLKVEAEKEVPVALERAASSGSGAVFSLQVKST